MVNPPVKASLTGDSQADQSVAFSPLLQRPESAVFCTAAAKRYKNPLPKQSSGAAFPQVKIASLE